MDILESRQGKISKYLTSQAARSDNQDFDLFPKNWLNL